MIALAWVVIAIFAPLIAPANPLAQTFTADARALVAATSSAPTSSAVTSSAA